MNIKTAYACALASQLAYEAADVITVGDIIFTVAAQPDGTTIVAFRGTVDCIADFAHDGDIVPSIDPVLGMLHGGFDFGSADYTAAVLANVTGDYYLTGHSLGGDRALICAARARMANRPPIGVCTFGAARPGCRELGEYLAPIDGLSFARNNDPIPDMVDPYKHPYSQHLIGDPVRHSMQIFINHQIARYCADLAQLAI